MKDVLTLTVSGATKERVSTIGQKIVGEIQTIGRIDHHVVVCSKD